MLIQKEAFEITFARNNIFGRKGLVPPTANRTDTGITNWSIVKLYPLDANTET